MRFRNKLVVTIFALALLVQTSIGFAPKVIAQKSNHSFTEDVHVLARLVADTSTFVPGKKFKLGVELKMQPHWHTYYKVSGDAGLPTKINWQLPVGFTAGPILWQKPEKFNDGGIVTYGYKDRTFLGAEITPPATYTAKSLKVTADVKWLSCAEICVPGEAKPTLVLPVGAATQSINEVDFASVGYAGPLPVSNDRSSSATSGANAPGASAHDATPAVAAAPGATAPSAASSPSSGGFSVLNSNFNADSVSQKPQSLLVYVWLALVGGLILNVMPCVLPVIAIKVLSFFEQARDESGRVRLLGLTFSAGIISSFLVLAILVIAVQATGKSVGWGFQFQYPPFLIAMASVVLVFALSLFGMFYVSAPSAGKVDELASREGVSGTFFKGVLATVLSTPCTAPFLGTALGFAFAQPAWTVLLIFFCIGLGMSLPYLLLCINPDWLKLLPKPGAWMEKFKESLGFILLATVAWLLSILGSELGIEAVARTTYFLISISFATWIISRFTDLSSSSSRKATVYAISLLFTGLAFALSIWTLPGVGAPAKFVAPATDVAATHWQKFTIDGLNRALNDHKTVLLDFTADWCLTCKVNEQTVLESKPVTDKVKALNVVTMQADWTVQDPTITRLLNKFNRSGVPLYVIFPADKPNDPIVLPEVITEQMMLDKLDQAGPSK